MSMAVRAWTVGNRRGGMLRANTDHVRPRLWTHNWVMMRQGLGQFQAQTHSLQNFKESDCRCLDRRPYVVQHFQRRFPNPISRRPAQDTPPKPIRIHAS